MRCCISLLLLLLLSCPALCAEDRGLHLLDVDLRSEYFWILVAEDTGRAESKFDEIQNRDRLRKEKLRLVGRYYKYLDENED